MINSRQGKIWGLTSCIFNRNNVEIHRIEAKKGGYCSTHNHKSKYNIFFVEKGLLKVTIFRWDAGQEIKDEILLSKGEMTSISPGIDHMFEAIEDTIAFEIYYVELDPSDIQRKNVGGIKNEKNHK